MIRLLCALCVLSGLSGQSLQPPTLGLIHDPATSSVRPIAGLPGAAHYAPPILTGITSASIAPTGESAIITNETGLFIITGLKDQPTSTQLSLDPSPFQAAWSATSAILWTPAAGFLRYTREGLATPFNPGLPPEAAVAALDYDEAQQLAFISAIPNGVYAYSFITGELNQILELAQPGSITHTGKTVYVVDRETHTIQTANGPIPIDNVTGPITASKDGNRLYIAGPKLRIYNSATSNLQEYDQPAQTLNRRNEIIQLTPTHYLTDTPSPTIFWIPSVSSESSAVKK